MAEYVGLALNSLIALCFCLGVYDVLKNAFKHCECEMSFMYELPQYKKVPLPEEISTKFPRYGLYLYGEGHYYKSISDLQPEGIPVLYLPGHMGSMKQCRSVASILLRKAEKQQWKPHFNVFSVDFDEEYAALHGSYLNTQIQFVKHSIEAILDLYQDVPFSRRPKSIVIVAHSMGGLVARGVIALTDLDVSSVSSIYSLATPHLYPVINLDRHIANTYDAVNSYWRENADKLTNVTLVSVSGDTSDFQVTGAVSRIPRHNKALNVAATMIPRVWLSPDHQCAVWCNQLILVLARSLFDSVDIETAQISEDADFRFKVARHHFIRNSLSALKKAAKESRVRLIGTYKMHRIKDMEWSSSNRDEDAESAYFLLDLPSILKQGRSRVIVKTTMAINHWILGCASLDCDVAVDLSDTSYITPDFRIAEINATELVQRDVTQLILKVPKISKHLGTVDVNILSNSVRRITVPSIFSNLWTLNQGYTNDSILQTSKGVFYHEVVLDGLQSIYHSYKVSVTAARPWKPRDTLIALKLPSHEPMIYSNSSEITVKLIHTFDKSNPTVHIYTDGNTDYLITVKPDFVGIVGQIVRHLWPVLPSMVAFNVMLAFSYQLKMILSENKCISTKEAHGISAKPYKLQPFINLVKALYGREWFSSAWNSFGLPIPDACLLDNVYGVWFALMPLVTFLFAANLFSVSLFILSCLMKCFSILCRKAGYSTLDDTRPTFLSSTFHTVILAGLVSWSSGLALVYISAINFMDLCILLAISRFNTAANEMECTTDSTSETTPDRDEDDSSTRIQKSEPDREQNDEDERRLVISTYNIKFSMQMIWLVLMTMSLPTVLSRIKGYTSASEDTWFPIAVFSSFLFTLHRQQPTTLSPSVPRGLVARFLYPITVIASITCLHSLYRLPYFLLSFLSVYVAMQYFG